MKNLTILIIFISFLCYGEVKKATYEEVKNSVQIVEEYVKENKENILSVFIEALEIEKRATNIPYAEKIKEKICKTGEIEEGEFKKLREKFSFFDISIGWALSQIEKISLDKILNERKTKSWEEIINKYEIYQKLIEKIKELNPKSETF